MLHLGDGDPGKLCPRYLPAQPCQLVIVLARLKTGASGKPGLGWHGRAFTGGAYQSHSAAPIAGVVVLADVAELKSSARYGVASIARAVNRRSAATSANHPLDQPVATPAASFVPGAHDGEIGG